MKIQYQLWLIFSCLFIIVCMAIYLILSNAYEYRLQAGYEQISLNQGTSVINQIKETYPHSPNRSVSYLAVHGDQLNCRLILLDQNKKVFADSFKEVSSNVTLNLPILEGDSGIRANFHETKQFGYVQYTLIPFESVDNEGYLLMIQEAGHLYDEITSFRKLMTQILLLFVLIFFVASYFASKLFSNPIRRIIEKLNKITPLRRTFSLKYGRNDEIKNLIVSIQNMVDELNLYDERQRRFLSTSSHELKTPIATIQLILENLPYVREDEASYQEFVQDLSYEVNKMKQIVEQVLLINKIGVQGTSKSLLNEQDVKDHLIQSFQYILEDKLISLVFDLESVHLQVHRELFLMGLKNLVSNAIRYSHPNQVVRVMICDYNQEVKISVIDEGIGITDSELPHIFEPFYRSNEATAWNQEGSGLGLAIVKQMVEFHKGKLEIDSQKGKGTKITLLFPKE